MTRITAILLIIVTLGIAAPLQAQSDSQPPYLYYYSRLLGGLIIERADGTDSRQIAADIIPPNMSGLAGPGWSPSGKYFVASGVDLGDYNPSIQGTYLIDTQGHRVIDNFDRNITAYQMEWSPTGEDWLLVTGVRGRGKGGLGDEPFGFWLVDVKAKTIAAEYVGNFYVQPNESTPIIWETQLKQIRFYIAPEAFSRGQYFLITIKFDGTVLKQPTTRAEFEANYIDPSGQIDDSGHENEISEGHAVSPSGRYEVSGKYPTLLHELKTGLSVELPTHTQGTVCRSYDWSADERYIITLDGTTRAGGSCGWAVVGVTDQNAALWRELGGCLWGSPCVGWLPPQVHIADVPSGQPKPIQLDPINYESAEMVLGWDVTPIYRLRCDDDGFKIVTIQKPDEVLFHLQSDQYCPYSSNDSFADVGLPINFAYDPHNKLLATYLGNEQPVSIWSMQKDIGQRILKLNTYGYELQFTADRKYLRARNVNGWKIYSVADILAAASTPK